MAAGIQNGVWKRSSVLSWLQYNRTTISELYWLRAAPSGLQVAQGAREATAAQGAGVTLNQKLQGDVFPKERRKDWFGRLRKPAKKYTALFTLGLLLTDY